MHLKVVTYNIHSCRGLDRKTDSLRVAEVLKTIDADIIALQEVDDGFTSHKRLPEEQAATIGEYLGYHSTFFPVRAKLNGTFGLSILSKHPMSVVKTGLLPSVQRKAKFERRGAIWANIEINTDGHRSEIQFVNTHLSLFRKERQIQVEDLLSGNWLEQTNFKTPIILAGDFNTWPRTLPYRKLSEKLEEVGATEKKTKRLKSFPARRPLLKLDHIFVSSHFNVRSVQVPSSKKVMGASDHLPLIAVLKMNGAL